jgi:hypothetical protein
MTKKNEPDELAEYSTASKKCLFRKICGLKVAFEHLAGFLKVVHNGPIREWV